MRLISVIILGAVGISISVSALILSSSDSINSAINRDSTQAKAYADTCAEIAVNAIKNNLAYIPSETGVSGTITFINGSCTVENVLGTGGTNRTIQVSGISNETYSRVEVYITTVHPQPIIDHWRQVGTF